MFIFHKARSPTETLNDLDEYLNGLDDKPVRWLARTVSGWGNEFSYDELAAVIQSGQLDELLDWQERWSGVINEQLAPLWVAAIAAASAKATGGLTVLNDSDWYVQSWIQNRGGELISQLSEESRRAVMNIILRGQGLGLAPRDVAKEIRPLIGLTVRQAQANVNYRDKVYQQYIDGGASPTTAAARADKAALKYAGKQHRYRAETIVLTENSFAYNRGAHMGVSQSIATGLMGRCEMVWTTAGTNRVCSRCLALKDTVVGHTDESGVTIPPLHPRCRCAIMYREVEAPRVMQPKPKPETNPTINPLASAAIATELVPPMKPKPAVDEAAIRTRLEEVRAERKIKGEIIYPPPTMDFSEYVFDAVHTQGDEHPHDVTEEEARKFIEEAYFVLDLSKIDSLNFFGAEGATYVRPKQKKIRTSFKREEYNPNIRALVEAYENEINKA